jgi:hypothetical protein
VLFEKEFYHPNLKIVIYIERPLKGHLICNRCMPNQRVLLNKLAGCVENDGSIVPERCFVILASRRTQVFLTKYRRQPVVLSHPLGDFNGPFERCNTRDRDFIFLFAEKRIGLPNIFQMAQWARHEQDPDYRLRLNASSLDELLEDVDYANLIRCQMRWPRVRNAAESGGRIQNFTRIRVDKHVSEHPRVSGGIDRVSKKRSAAKVHQILILDAP